MTIFAFVCGFGVDVGRAASSTLGSSGIRAASFQTWTVMMPSNLMAGTSVKGSVEIPGPPPPNSTSPPFKVQIMLNGWAVAEPLAHYNYEKNLWEFDIVVPPGTSGGTLKIWIHPSSIDLPSISPERKIG